MVTSIGRGGATGSTKSGQGNDDEESLELVDFGLSPVDASPSHAKEAGCCTSFSALLRRVGSGERRYCNKVTSEASSKMILLEINNSIVEDALRLRFGG